MRLGGWSVCGVVLILAACSAAPGNETSGVASVESPLTSGITWVDGTVAAFKPVGGNEVYVLGTDGKLWDEQGDKNTRTLVDVNVLAFQPIPSSRVVWVLDRNHALWRDYPTSVTRDLQPVDTNVAAFHALDAYYVYVKGTDNKLWREHGTWRVRDPIASNVNTFQPIDAGSSYYLDVWGSLWRTGVNVPSNLGPALVDSNVASFEGLDDLNVLSLRADGRLFAIFDSAYFTGHSALIDKSVAGFAQSRDNVVYVTHTDGTLWRELFDSGASDYAFGGVTAVQAASSGSVYTMDASANLFRLDPEGPMCTASFPRMTCEPQVLAWATPKILGGCPNIPAADGTGTWMPQQDSGVPCSFSGLPKQIKAPDCSTVVSFPCCTYVWSSAGTACSEPPEPSAFCGVVGIQSISAIAVCAIECPSGTGQNCVHPLTGGCDVCTSMKEAPIN
jgi:hypothetical protein